MRCHKQPVLPRKQEAIWTFDLDTRFCGNDGGIFERGAT